MLLNVAYVPIFFMVFSCCRQAASVISYRQPTIMVVLLARNKEHSLPYFLTLFEQLDYPKKRMALYIRADHCEDRTVSVLETWLASAGHLYHALDVQLDKNSTLYPGETSCLEKVDATYEGIIYLKEQALQKAREIWADYVWFLDVDIFITEHDLIGILLEENQAIIAPMINSLGRYSNFWGGMSDEYWYVRTEQYLNILDRKEKGCFSVPMVHSCVLVNLKIAETDHLTFNPDVLPEYSLPLDDIIAFAISAKDAGLEMTVCNELIYGFMTPPVVDKERPELDMLRLISLKLEVLVTLPPLPVNPLLQHFLPSPPSKDKLHFDQVYLINLERRPERRQRMENCFTELGLNVVVVDTVDGKSLDDTELKRRGITFLPGYKDPWAGRQMTYGEVGCFLSHYNVWKDVVENSYEKVLLFEDDIRFEPFFREHIINLLKNINSTSLDWDLIYLGRKKLKTADEPWVSGSEQLVHVDYSYWTLCYLLSGRGAAKLLAAQPLQRLLPVDEFLPIMFDKHPQSDWASAFPARDLVAYSVAPLLVYPTHYTGEVGYISDTEESLVLPESNRDGPHHPYLGVNVSLGAAGERSREHLLPGSTPAQSIKNVDVTAFGEEKEEL